MESDFGEIWPIDDARVPQWVRERGRRFRQPAAYAERLGEDEFVLFAVDGELIEVVTGPERGRS